MTVLTGASGPRGLTQTENARAALRSSWPAGLGRLTQTENARAAPRSFVASGPRGLTQTENARAAPRSFVVSGPWETDPKRERVSTALRSFVASVQ